jgi:hypothetical protein
MGIPSVFYFIIPISIPISISYFYAMARLPFHSSVMLVRRFEKYIAITGASSIFISLGVGRLTLLLVEQGFRIAVEGFLQFMIRYHRMHA